MCIACACACVHMCVYMTLTPLLSGARQSMPEVMKVLEKKAASHQLRRLELRHNKISETGTSLLCAWMQCVSILYLLLPLRAILLSLICQLEACARILTAQAHNRPACNLELLNLWNNNLGDKGARTLQNHQFLFCFCARAPMICAKLSFHFALPITLLLCFSGLQVSVLSVYTPL